MSVAEGFRGLAVPKRVKRLGQEAVDIYMEQLDQALEREVRPLEEQTKKLYAVCVERAEQLGVSNRYTEEARRRLNALDPGAYPLTQRRPWSTWRLKRRMVANRRQSLEQSMTGPERGKEQRRWQALAAAWRHVGGRRGWQHDRGVGPGNAGSAPSGLVRSALQSVHRGQHEAAIRQCKQALRRDEKYTPAMEVMARAYYHLGKTEFAAAICDIALGIDPRSAKCHNLKGFVALKEQDRHGRC